jgi:hypothetical protein
MPPGTMGRAIVAGSRAPGSRSQLILADLPAQIFNLLDCLPFE